jgi:hypothetical protein
MKNKLIIILAICLYTSVVAYIFDNVGTQTLIRNGGTYDTNMKTQNGYKCLIRYLDKDSKLEIKPLLAIGFEEKEVASCPQPWIEKLVIKSELVKIVETRLMNPDEYKFKSIIIPTER